MDVKMNLRIITKNHADDSKIGSSLKIDFKAKWTHESMPTAWVLSVNYGDGTLLDQYRNKCLLQEFTHIWTSVVDNTLSFG